VSGLERGQPGFFLESTEPALLVSVRDASEARQAVAGGCDVLDVKEPSRGPLGMADPATIAGIAQVRDELGVDLPLSIALGEAVNWESDQRAAGFIPAGGHQSKDSAREPLHAQFIKLGTARLGSDPDWAGRFRAACELAARAGQGGQVHVFRSGVTPARQDRLAEKWTRPQSAANTPLCTAQAIVVAYADWRVAASPPPANVVAAAATLGCVGVLIDTFSKSGGGLFDCLSLAELLPLRSQAREYRLLFALAGRLSRRDVPRLREVMPDVVGIRSAACRDGQREREIDRQAVAGFREELRREGAESTVRIQVRL
jgi:uncharacterized protein (UPF0264 family)